MITQKMTNKFTKKVETQEKRSEVYTISPKTAIFIERTEDEVDLNDKKGQIFGTSSMRIINDNIEVDEEYEWLKDGAIYCCCIFEACVCILI